MASSFLDVPDLPRRVSTAEAAAAVLRAQITQGELRPGQRLHEEGLAATWAISRNTVREALRLLSRDRLVEHILNRGVFVRIMTSDDVIAMYSTRRVVEPIGLPALSADSSAIDQAREVTRVAEAAADRGDWTTVGTADVDFHRLLVASAGSLHLSAMFEQVLAELRLAFLQVPKQNEIHEPFVLWNSRLFQLIERGDVASARDEVSNYLMTSERKLLDAMTVHSI